MADDRRGVEVLRKEVKILRKDNDESIEQLLKASRDLADARAKIGELQNEVDRQKKMVVHGTCWCGATFEFTADHANTNCEHLDVDRDVMHGYTWDVKIGASFEAWVKNELTSETESHERTHRIGLKLQDEVETLRAEVAKPRCPVATGTCAGCPHAKRSKVP
jgi:hypothetical protein